VRGRKKKGGTGRLNDRRHAAILHRPSENACPNNQVNAVTQV
jgi:hypothetical protein